MNDSLPVLVIVCARDDDPDRRPIAGSEHRHCAECAALLWVAPATLQRSDLGDYQVRFQCLGCTAPHLDGVSVRAPTLAQRAELTANGFPDVWPFEGKPGVLKRKGSS
jgi:hypothetical protein